VARSSVGRHYVPLGEVGGNYAVGLGARCMKSTDLRCLERGRRGGENAVRGKERTFRNEVLAQGCRRNFNRPSQKGGAKKTKGREDLLLLKEAGGYRTKD